MVEAGRGPLFDHWAEGYDRSIDAARGFPFETYERVLDTVLTTAAPRPDQRMLDVGTGTGRLAARFASKGCVVAGVDFSREMLSRAKRAVPSAAFHSLDLLGRWDAIAEERFDHIVSSFVFHEFPDEESYGCSAISRRITWRRPAPSRWPTSRSPTNITSESFASSGAIAGILANTTGSLIGRCANSPTLDCPAVIFR